MWLTDAAVEDLYRLDGAALVWALKKMLVLETDPQAGEPLVGTLIGYRKLVVCRRDWRLIWRVLLDQRGSVSIEVAEVWAVGARSDAQVYAELEARVQSLPEGPARRSLHDVVTALGRRARGVEARPPLVPTPAPEPWLVERLVCTAGLNRRAVEAMTSEQAVDAWTEYMMRGR